ncbi:MAG TPA: response regulator [Sphingobium sp.]|nr:response regulator [Sphingobium sp.]
MTESKRRTKVYVVDDSLTFRAMLDTLVSQDDDLEICGMASSAEAALDEIGRHQPDIILLDQTLPGMDSLAFLDALKAQWHGTHVVMISLSGDQDMQVCRMALGKGAVACFDKARLVRSANEFMTLMNEIRAGEIHPDWHEGRAVTLGSNAIRHGPPGASE